MTDILNNSRDLTLVAIDIAKKRHDACIQFSNGNTAQLKFENTLSGYQRLWEICSEFQAPIRIGFEPTADYHRNIAHWFERQGAQCHLVSSLSCARAREMLYQTWDKNDRKDTKVILYLLNQGISKPFYDPLVNQTMDIQELSNTYHQITVARTRCLNSLVNHNLTLYFPEAEQFLHNSRSEWFCDFLLKFPTPASITRYRKDTFVKRAWNVIGRKQFKQQFLEHLYDIAKVSIGLPVPIGSVAIETFRLQLRRYLELTRQRLMLEKKSEEFLADRNDYQRLKTLPGVGSIIGLIIIAESGDLTRFHHYRQYLNYCGFNLSALQSGNQKGNYKLSKRGNARLRYGYWLAANAAIRMKENSFRYKYERYIKAHGDSADTKRKARTAVAVKLARVAHSIVKNDVNYHGYFEVCRGT